MILRKVICDYHFNLVLYTKINWNAIGISGGCSEGDELLAKMRRTGYDNEKQPEGMRIWNELF